MIAALIAAGWLLQQIATGERHAALVERFLAPDQQPLLEYRAIRHLRASTRGGKLSADMEVMTAFDPQRGFSFTILSESGSGLIRRRVLLEALLTEQRTVASALKHESALTLANYEFLAPLAADTALATLDIRARRKSVMLVNGTLYLDPDRADLVRVEGELADRPSFWTRRVRVVRSYDRIAGVHVPVGMESTADVRIVGASTFAMSYQYLEINGQKVEAVH
jgi:hypothetical protein